MPQNASDPLTTITISSGVLHGSNRVATEQPPLFRNNSSEHLPDEVIEIPVPGAITEQTSAVRVLHVDDDPQYTDLTETLLEDADDAIEVEAKTSVVEALNLLKERSFDCIISDYEMPNTDGLEFLELVREQYPDLPFILFTGKGSEEIASEAISAGVTDYVQKKGNVDQYEVLANRVRNAVDRYRAQRQFWDALSWYQRLIEQDLAGVFILQDGEFVYVNQHFATMFGFSQGRLVGEAPEVVFSDRIRTLILDSPESEASDDKFQVEGIGHHADGSELRLEIHGGFIQYQGEQGQIGIVIDRTG